MFKPSLNSNLIKRWQLFRYRLCQLLSLDLLLLERGFFRIAEFPSSNSDVSEADPGVALTRSGARRSVAGRPSRGKPQRRSGGEAALGGF